MDKPINLLSAAVTAQECLWEIQSNMMFEIAGESAFDPWNDMLANAVMELIDRAMESVEKLSPRARKARLNLIWMDFVKDQKKLLGGLK